MDPNDAAEQRANAVAKLRRAASLPRMKNGRRPQMPGNEAVSLSEGERADGSPPSGTASGTEADDRAPGQKPKIERETEGGDDSLGSSEGKITPALTASPSEPSDSLPSASSKSAVASASASHDPPSKRRSRSRSRSRGSKDLKAKMKTLESVMPNGLSPPNHNNNYESADEYPQFSLRSAPVDVITPLLTSGNPHLSPFAFYTRLPPPHYQGVSPSPLPSLEAIQSRHLQQGGLYRSSSAAARMMAMRKLTGEPVDPQLLGITPTHSPLGFAGGKLTRNNTVAGGERLAARQLMFRRLGERLEKTDGEQTSGGEDLTASAKNRRRRSRRKSGSSSVVDDRELTATPSANTPTPVVTAVSLIDTSVLTTPIASTSALAPLQPVGSPDFTSHRLSPRMAEKSDAELADYALPRGHRGIVVEDEDEIPEPERETPTQPRHNLGLPETLSHASAQIAALRTHIPATTSVSVGSQTIFDYTLPTFREDEKEEKEERRSPFRHDAFSKNPFGTPIQEERVVYRDQSDRLYGEIREPSWDCEPGSSSLCVIFESH